MWAEREPMSLTLVLLPHAALVLSAIADKDWQLHFTALPSAQVLLSSSFLLAKLLRETVNKIPLPLLLWLPPSSAGLWHGSQTDAWGVDCRKSGALLEVMEEELTHLQPYEELPQILLKSSTRKIIVRNPDERGRRRCESLRAKQACPIACQKRYNDFQHLKARPEIVWLV